MGGRKEKKVVVNMHTHTHTHTHTQDVPDYEVQWRIEKQKPGQCAALIYTSGTTGPPKVYMICSSPVQLNCICVTLCGRIKEAARTLRKQDPALP